MPVPVSTEQLDRLFDALGDPRRRQLCAYMHTADRSVFGVDELVDELLRRVETRADTPDRTQLEVRLHHAHVPKLTEAGLVEYDSRQGSLRYRGDERFVDVDFIDVESLLEQVEARTDAGSASTSTSVDR
ncbi:DUF7344 domain-containing protein [Haloarchaeobius sp. HRN-SO-5]|uniref:DUF7344 domain-containing protein n=1 Tax=Haloarchaeobius sp. HRN-SO-5 TaxID=3446118 RepID=UPI003EB7B014